MNNTTVLQIIADEFALAKKTHSKDTLLAKRIVKKARKLAQKKQVRLPSHLRRQYCHNCYQILIPSLNCTIRTTNSCVVYTCAECKHLNKFRIKS